MKAVVLAAGKGTRMREITDSIPKPMVEISGRPILWHILSALSQAGVEEAAIIVGYMGGKIRDYFGDGGEVGLPLRYFEQKVQDGTGRAAEPAKEFLRDGPFFLTFGDILTDAGAYRAMSEAFSSRPTDLLLAVRHVDEPSRFGVVELDGDRITSIVEKPAPGTEPSNLVNAGILIARPTLFEYTARLEPSERDEYELPDAFRMMMDDGRNVRAFDIRSHWRDIGTPEDLEAAGGEVDGRDDIVGS